MTLETLPMINAGLNAASAIFLLAGYGFIRQGNRSAHRFCMVTAFTVSVIFLLSYLIHHALAGIIHYQGQGWVRTFYFFILTTHTLLAVLVPFLALVTLLRALKGNFERHKKIARITFPIWLYVSVTGVLVYFMLYRDFLR
ncbi:MAG TPA: DUF420 domain-containing protein [bacterium]|nr:DUF420 domain-containing protein [bacterium]